MKTFPFLSALLICASGSAQAPPPSSDPKPLSVPAETVVATVNGRKLTAADVQKMVAGVPPQAQEAYRRDPKQFLREYAWYMHLQALADKNKLDQQSPYKEILEFQRLLTLVQ